MLLIKGREAWIWYRGLSFEEQVGHPGRVAQQGVRAVHLDKGGNSWLKDALEYLKYRTSSNYTLLCTQMLWHASVPPSVFSSLGIME